MLCVEPLNRFETSFMNLAQQAIDVVDRVDHPACGILLDTFHMNIEERSIGEAIRAAGARLKHLHGCENDRGAPGSGHVPWNEVRDALRAVNYDGPVVIESFTSKVKTIARAAAIWRPFAATQDALAEDGLRFLRQLLAQDSRLLKSAGGFPRAHPNPRAAVRRRSTKRATNTKTVMRPWRCRCRNWLEVSVSTSVRTTDDYGVRFATHGWRAFIRRADICARRPHRAAPRTHSFRPRRASQSIDATHLRDVLRTHREAVQPLVGSEISLSEPVARRRRSMISWLASSAGRVSSS